MGPLAAGPGGRWRTSSPRRRTSRHASTVVRKVAPIMWRAIVPASKRQAGQGRSRTHVQFLSSGLGCSIVHLHSLFPYAGINSSAISGRRQHGCDNMDAASDELLRRLALLLPAPLLLSWRARRKGRRYNTLYLSSPFGWLIPQSVCFSYDSNYLLEEDDLVVHRSAQADVGSYNERGITCAQ